MRRVKGRFTLQLPESNISYLNRIMGPASSMHDLKEGTHCMTSHRSHLPLQLPSTSTHWLPVAQLSLKEIFYEDYANFNCRPNVSRC